LSDAFQLLQIFVDKIKTTVELILVRIELERDEFLKGCLSLVAGRVKVDKNKIMNS
jgi:hypothetical protein